MIFNIICHYTFHSNELNPVLSFLMLVGMGIFLLFAIYIWIGNKVDDYKLNKEIKKENDLFTIDAENIINSNFSSDKKLNQIRSNYNWKSWFIKGYIEGVKYGNRFYDPNNYREWNYKYTIEEWESFHQSSMTHIKDNSDYFGGNKEIALYAYFLGHKFGNDRYIKKPSS
ncbi:MAG: hypothetical protein HDS65_06335 [Bacteroidales bacterium]|nr:hypothetical protein [Bacteroidales bacterium]